MGMALLSKEAHVCSAFGYLWEVLPNRLWLVHDTARVVCATTTMRKLDRIAYGELKT